MNSEYDDVNYYCKFITSQIEWRNKLLANDNLKSYSLWEHSVIHAAGIRASGATTAISKLFNKDKDLYIGHSRISCTNFANLINAKNLNFNYINFNSLDFDNTNIEKDIIYNKIKDFFVSNNFEILKYDIDYRENFSFNKPKIKFDQVDLDNIKTLMKDHIFENSVNEINSLRGKFDFYSKDSVVYIDLGTHTHRNFSIKVNNIIKYIASRAKTTNLIFVLT